MSASAASRLPIDESGRRTSLTVITGSDELSESRTSSLQTLTELCRLMGYPESWAHTLEEQSFARGRVWSRTA
jgi:hypothetical protein